MTTVEERTARGYGILLLAKYVDEELPSEAAGKIRSELAPFWGRLHEVKEDGAYPFEDMAAVLRAIAATEPTVEAGYARVQRAGVFIGNHALSTALRLLFKFLRPSIFARKVTDLWARDHNFGRFVAKMGDEPNTMIGEVHDVVGYPYVSAVCAGWSEAALHAMGCQDVTWKETLHPPPASQDAFDSYRIEIAWR